MPMYAPLCATDSNSPMNIERENHKTEMHLWEPNPLNSSQQNKNSVDLIDYFLIPA